MTREEKNRIQREQRALNGNRYTKKYEKTEKGFIMRLYRNMKSRISGIQKQKIHLYSGKELLSKEDFYSWVYYGSERQFFNMFDEYKESGYDRKLAPTVDRIDSSKGYIIGNMRWLTHSENSRQGSLSQRKTKIL